MKSLLIVDSEIEPGALCRIGGCMGGVDIFALASDARFLNAVVSALAGSGHPEVRILNSAQAVDREVSRLRTRIHHWSAAIADAKIGEKSVRERLLLKDGLLSSWWLGLIAEKNNLKTDIFLRLTQVNAVRKAMSAGGYEQCLIAVGDQAVRESIERVCRRFGAVPVRLPVYLPASMQARIRRLSRNIGLVGEIASGLVAWARFCRRAWLARRVMGPRRIRYPDGPSTLFVSYFPAFDEDAARSGVFRNKYGPALQDLLQHHGRCVTWLFLCTEVNGMGFRRAATQARLFADRGETMFLVEEFLQPRDCLAALLAWVRQGWIGRRVYRAVDRAVLFAEPVGEDCEPLVERLWNASFWGAPAMQGLLFYAAFRRMFREAGPLEDCLYHWEMHAWERALLAARNSEQRHVRTVGILHSSAPRNYWPYFPSPSEIRRSGRPADLPMPDIIAVGGRKQHEVLAESGYSGLTEVEAVRYLYLDDTMAAPRCARSQVPLLLVAGSIDRRESLAVLGLVAAAFPRAEGFDIWLKAHPCMPFEPLLAELGMDPAAANYKIHQDDIHDCLGAAWAVLVPSSTVAIEALAFGCEVIAPVFADAMLMNPLADFEGWCRRVTSPEELKAAMEAVRMQDRVPNPDMGLHFVRSYWNLDKTLRAWSALLPVKEHAASATNPPKVHFQ